MASVGESQEYQRLRNEYHQTIRVLSVIVGQLLKHERGDTIEISDKALLEAPDIEAWRDTDRALTCIRVVL